MKELQVDSQECYTRGSIILYPNDGTDELVDYFDCTPGTWKHDKACTAKECDNAE